LTHLHHAERQMALDASRLGLWQWTVATGEVTYSAEIERILRIGRDVLGSNIEEARQWSIPTM
jgi:hypothetical protein